ncbi:MAG: hypothetical protein ACI8P9_004378, partial [Parasphingorhabdus sp.]
YYQLQSSNHPAPFTERTYPKVPIVLGSDQVTSQIE